MYEDTVYKIINQHIKENKITPEDASEDLQTFGMDSIMFIRIMVALEEALDIEIPDDYLLMDKMNSVDKILNALSSLKAE